METGRNDPCHCGSGKKYKKCCLQKDTAGPARPTLDFVYESNLAFRRKTTDKMGRLTQEFAIKPDLEAFLEEYWSNPFLTDREKQALQSHPQGEPVTDGQMAMAMQTAYRFGDSLPGRFFLEKLPTRFSPSELRFLRDWSEARLSYFQVREIYPESGYTDMEDVFDGSRFNVYDKGIALGVKPYDIISGRLVPFPEKGGHVLEPLATSVILPFQKEMVIDLIIQMAFDFVRKLAPRRRSIPTDAEIFGYLRENPMVFFWMDMRIWHDRLFTAPPTLANTDGDALVFIKARYAVKDASALLAALLRQKNFDHEREKDVDVFTWLNRKDMVTGKLRLDTRRGEARLETNSRERFRKWEKKLRTLGEVVFLDKTEESTDSLREKNASGKSADFEWVPTGGQALPPEAMQELGPQIEKQLADMWLKERIPALGNRTPVEATKTAEGRKRLEELFRYMENQEARLPPGLAGGGFDIEKMRRRLGMGEV